MATKDETGPGSGTVARDEDEPFAHDLRAVLGSIGEAVYDWDIASDRIAWSGA